MALKRFDRTAFTGLNAKRLWKWTGLLIFCLVVLTRPAHLYARDWMDWQNPAYIEKAFVEIAFKNEYRPGISTLTKWNEPIRYRFIYQHTANSPLIEELFQVHLAQLQQITQLSIQQASPADTANLTIILTQDRLYKQAIQTYTNSRVKNLERESNCMGSYQLDAQGAISKGVIILPVDFVFSRGILTACVIEETTQLMGLPNDSDWVTPSIANDVSQMEFLTGLDYTFLKILYNPNLTAGMTLEQSRPIIRRIIQTLQNEGSIKNADKQVKSQGLYRLLN